MGATTFQSGRDSRPKRVFGRIAVAALAFVLLGACKVDVAVGIDADADGTGEIRVTAQLDEEAAEELEEMDESIRTDDLEAAGWEVAPIEPTDDGGLAITVTKPYASPEEANAILTQLAGGATPAEGQDPTAPAPPFEDLTLRQRRTFFRTTTEFAGTVNLTRGVEAFTDPRLQSALGGQPLGVPVEQLERQLRAPFNEIFGLQVAVELPGGAMSNAPTTAGDAAVWAPALGDRVELTAEASQWNVRNIALLTVAIGAAIAFVVVVLTRRRRSGGATPD